MGGTIKEMGETIFLGKKKNYKNEALRGMEDLVASHTGKDLRTKFEKAKTSDLFEKLSSSSGKIIERIIENTSLIEESIEEIISEIYDYADNLNVDYFIEGKYPKEITDFINDIDSLIDFKNESEYMFLEKIYYGEIYAEYYKSFNNYNGGICLQNDWSYRVRKTCENYEKRINNYIIRGCEFPHRNKPKNCVLRYNYDKKICEPAATYCRAYGIDPMIKTPKNHKVNIEMDKKEKVFEVGVMNDCKNNMGQEVAEFLFGTTITRFAKNLGCPLQHDCCHDIDCKDKYKDKNKCIGHICKKYASPTEIIHERNRKLIESKLVNPFDYLTGNKEITKKEVNEKINQVASGKIFNNLLSSFNSVANTIKSNKNKSEDRIGKKKELDK